MTQTYGLLFTDIVQSFSQTDVTDFAVGNVTGQTIIENEIEFQALKLNDIVPEYLQNLTEHVDLEIVSVNTSGNFSPGLYAISGSVEAWIIPKGYMPCSINSFYGSDGTCGLYSPIGEAPTEASITYLGSNLYHLNDAFDSKKQQLVISYDVDSTQADYGILKTLLRDMVCCALGNRIYPVAQGDKWSIVKYYCDEATKYQDLLQSGKFNNTLGLNLLFKKNAFTTIRTMRG